MNAVFRFPAVRWLGAICLLLGTVVGLRATTVVPPAFADMVNQSDYVVRVRVDSATATADSSAPQSLIHTNVQLTVLQVIAGQPPADLTLRFLGGKVGDRALVVDGMPSLAVGDEFILFVTNNGRSLCPVYAMGYGAYPIRQDAATGRRYVTREDHVPLASVDEISQPLGTTGAGLSAARRMDPARGLTPGQFVQQIQAVRHAEGEQRANLN